MYPLPITVLRVRTIVLSVGIQPTAQVHENLKLVQPTSLEYIYKCYTIYVFKIYRL